ncbi:putative bifunctional diguanylate cyclase/phosphodiesterase [Halomonas urumqiensis]|uniref:cyclic-guanylate-specific phosphodiesterase n=1 Tax=Halomonas urumqiensis TaxID=1684789 RepID=A0A2N7UKC4_9GAMM|nr:EAL domain-containing protein [Halomonas urumqiensis]PMR80875.1 GGDEF domain-containing protein [Halomonas urumqiensis]PTB02832.1 sensor domain-containing phosphodiesterase [Halomonas urumqiensis]GHE21345.1 GGDEF domain-containing protein [Halomonas urumqiensis]
MSFRRRLLVVMLAVVILAQLVTAAATLRTLERDVLEKGGRDLGVGLDVMQQLLAERGARLRNNVAILAADFGFKSAVATQDTSTIESVLANHGDRAGADMVLLTTPDGQLLASSHHAPDAQTPYPALWREAMDNGESVQVVIEGGEPYQVVLLPVHAPGLIGWVGMGFLLDDALASEIGTLTGLDTSVLTVGDPQDTPYIASPMSREARGRLMSLPDQLAAGRYLEASRFDPDTTYLTRASLLQRSEQGSTYLVAQLSRQALLAVYADLRWQLLAIFVATLLLTALMAAWSARRMARPLGTLADAARRIGQGEHMARNPVSDGGEVGLLGDTLMTMQQDIDLRERTLLYQSRHDQLTDLANRHAAQQEIDSAIARGQPFTLLRLSINGFRAINDTFGYEIGDQVLKTLASRLRAQPWPLDEAYRLSGNEFLLLLDQPATTPGWVEALHRQLAEPIDFRGSPIRPTLSMGEVRHPEHGDNATLLLRRSEIALDMARQARQRYQCYVEGLDERHLRQLTLVRDLQDAARQQQLSMVYQPQLDARTGRLIGVEALMRWQHPTLGFIPPDEFIELAERSGNIQRLTGWMLDSVCAQLQRWNIEGHGLSAAVNLSARDVNDDTLPERINDCLASHGLTPDRLRLEITESAIMHDPDHASRQLATLRRAGLSIAVDDFGTGYSSLAQLKRLPVQELKIDKSFILKLDESADDEIIVRSTIELGHNLGLAVVAEGVETESSRALLAGLGCDILQGYLFSRPLPADQLILWAQAHSHITSGDAP